LPRFKRSSKPSNFETVALHRNLNSSGRRHRAAAAGLPAILVLSDIPVIFRILPLAALCIEP
jgi:hypothetical protein